MKHIYILFGLILLLTSCNVNTSNTILVSNNSVLYKAIKEAKAGDIILLKNGIWKDVEIKFRGKEKKLSYNYCVGKKKINYKLKNNKILRLLNKKDFIQKEFGRFYCYISSTKYLMKSIKKKIALDKNFLIK